jgi:hypothetical protein
MMILLFIAHPPFKNVLVLCKERGNLKGSRQRPQRGKSKSPWSLHIRSFWKIPLINPPVHEGKMKAYSITGRSIAMQKYQNLQVRSIGK